MFCIIYNRCANTSFNPTAYSSRLLEFGALKNVQIGYRIYYVWIRNGDIQYDHDTYEPGSSVNDFRCPLCDEVICTSEEEANNFLSEKLTCA